MFGTCNRVEFLELEAPILTTGPVCLANLEPSLSERCLFIPLVGRTNCSTGHEGLTAAPHGAQQHARGQPQEHRLTPRPPARHTASTPAYFEPVIGRPSLASTNPEITRVRPQTSRKIQIRNPIPITMEASATSPIPNPIQKVRI